MVLVLGYGVAPGGGGGREVSVCMYLFLVEGMGCHGCGDG
jgi:hypothetical protein